MHFFAIQFDLTAAVLYIQKMPTDPKIMEDLLELFSFEDLIRFHRRAHRGLKIELMEFLTAEMDKRSFKNQSPEIKWKSSF